MTRDVAPWTGYHMPALIESSFFPALLIGELKEKLKDMAASLKSE